MSCIDVLLEMTVNVSDWVPTQMQLSSHGRSYTKAHEADAALHPARAQECSDVDEVVVRSVRWRAKRRQRTMG